MKQFFLTVAGVFVGLLLFVVGVPFLLVVIAAGAARPAPPPAHAVLQLDLREGLTDQAPRNPFAALGGSGDSVMSIIETLRRAEKDDKVRAILVRLPEGGVAQKLPFKANVRALRDVRLKGGATLEVDDLRVDNSIAMRLERISKAFGR